MKKVLVVDDDESILEAIQVSLEFDNYTVIPLSEGDAVQEMVRKHKPDLIILDVLLSGYDGRDIAKLLKSDHVTRSIPIIMASAHPNVKQTVLDAGANDFLAKPFTMDNLLSLAAQYTQD